MGAYSMMREAYEFAAILRQCIPGRHGKKRTSILTDKHKVNVRAAMKKVRDPLLFPLTKESRIHYPKDDYESWTEYGIYEDKGYSYEELKEFFDEQYVDVRCDYSPTGRPYTRYIHWKRTPIGIAYAIHWGLDV